MQPKWKNTIDISTVRKYALHVVTVFCLLITFFPETVMGQYFGKNKVQYEEFDFKTLQSPHYNIYHYCPLNMAKDIGKMSELWYNRYQPVFKDTFYKPNPVVIYSDHPDFQQTEVVSGLIDVGTGGVTEGLKVRLVMPLSGSYGSTNHVLGHEMCHVFQYRMMLGSDSLSLSSLYNIPLWMIEGLAEYLSLGSINTQTSMWLRDGLIHNDLPTLKKMTMDYKYNPYRYGHAFWAFVTGTWGDSIINPLFLNSAGFGYERAIFMTLGIDEDSLSQLWIQSIKESYAPALENRTDAIQEGNKIISSKKNGGTLNLAPAVSPDGKYITFLSERDVFTIDLFLAEASTGKIIRKIGSSASNTHYDALNFTESSGCWSPDSRKFAFTAYSKGSTNIIITNVETGKIERKIDLVGIGMILNPAWSFDGKSFVFSGTSGNMADLYTYSLERDTLIRLTNDKYADLQPEWSPDGKNIVFVTDRGAETNFEKHYYGKMKLASYNIEKQKITLFPLFQDATHFNPKFTQNGEDLYFIADPDGINNIYRYNLKEQKIYRVTDVVTGVFGLAGISPAFSISHQNEILAFSIFETLNYNIYTLSKEQLHGRASPLGSKAGFLPPKNRTANNYVNDYLSETDNITLPEDSFRVRSYLPQFGLDNLSGLSAGVVSNQFGLGFAGGVSLLFSDILNRHNLYALIQANGQLRDVAGQVIYLNRKKRLTWGAGLSHIPYISSFDFITVDTIINETDTFGVLNYHQDILRTFEERALLIQNYPISISNRINLGAGFTYIHYSRELRTFSATSGFLQLEEIQKLPVPDPIGFANFTAAFVHDNAFFGLTAPLKGDRYYLGVETNIGTISYATLTADYRKYFYIKPFSLAFRTLHYGRYFGDSENSRLAPLYLGYEFFVRGYGLFSFDFSECNGEGDCPVYDRLFGSKIAFGNVEIRLPFTGPERLAIIKSRFIFTSLNVFFDGGIAWTQNEAPVLKITTTSNERIPVFSTGLSARFNLLGGFVLEIFGAYPFQRPDKGLHLGFLINPGW